MNEKIKEGELVEFNPSNIKAFSEFESQLKELEIANSKAVFDYEDSKGNQEARSHIHKLRKTKAAVEKARKQAKQNALEYGRAVDAKAKEISSEIESMIDVHLKPIEEIEQRERKRKDAIRLKMDALKIYEQIPQFTQADELRQILNSTIEIVIDDSFDEYKLDAESLKELAVKELTERIKNQEAYEAEQIELEKLRKEKAEREESDRIEKIKQEAANRARIEAEQKAEKERAEAKEREERQQIEMEMQIEEARLAIERAEKAAADAERKAAEEQELKQKKELEEIERREADKKHRAKLHRESIEDLVKCGLNENQAKLAITAISAGSVRNIKINY